MDRVSVYIKKLIVLILSAFLVYFLFFFLILPVASLTGFLVLAILNYKITGEKPEFLFGLKQSNNDLNRKGGFWLLLKWFVLLFGLIYDILVWTIFGMYVLFMLFIDFFLLLNTIVYWMIFGILWFLRLFVPGIVFIFRILIHYLVYWPWWIYRLSFDSAEGAVNRNMLFLAFRGALTSLFLAFLFIAAGILVDLNLVWLIGIAFAILPLVWAYGEIAALRKHGREFDEYYKVKSGFSSGYDAVRAVLFYLSVFILLVFLEYFINMMGWIPKVGFTLLGLAVNLNTFISLVLLFVLVILIFAKCILPPHVAEVENYRNDVQNSYKFLGVIGRKFLRYIFAHVPGIIVAFLLAVIPAFLVGLAVIFTLSMKNAMLDREIDRLKQEIVSAEGAGKYSLENRIRNYEYYKSFPLNVARDFSGLKNLIHRKNAMEEQLSTTRASFKNKSNRYRNEVDSLRQQLHLIPGKETQTAGIDSLLSDKSRKLDLWEQQQKSRIMKQEARLSAFRQRIIQLPLLSLLVIIWLSVFGAFIVTVVVAYFGNLYHALYVFREDGKPSFITETAYEIHQKDRKQPLLGLTLLGILLILVFIRMF